ncbi:MAG: hypothetical protein BJ554DRAFT_5162 [Olpidium bornovanus]|uniref:Doublecortin domain-containing protein n=1 Tax=Olpidium bornovanus TaxID=278681 RepID=A0A8H7ZJ76_9FUNG|nr:MAG: hypothetical protein BJ554DRAFT_5162 [Olpidium bornovanus]
MAAAPQPAANSQVAYRSGGRRRADAAAVAQTKRIFVYRNGDAFNPGKRVVVADRVYRNWEALLASLTSLLDLTGAVRRLFDVGGKSVRHLDEICDGADYVAAPGGETFRKVAYPVAATHSRMAPAGGGNGREGRVGRSIARKGSAAAPRSPTRADAAVEAEQARKAPGEKSRDSSVSRMFGPTVS